MKKHIKKGISKRHVANAINSGAKNLEDRKDKTVENASLPSQDSSRKIDWSSILTLPNFITSLRIIAAPFVMYTILTGRYAAAFFILLFAAMTDSFDGKVARVLGKQSQFGAILDPIADVTLTTCTVIALLIQFQFPLWFGIIVLSREALIILGGIACLIAGKFTLAKANLVGKLSRFFQLASVIAYVLAYIMEYYALWIDILLYVTALLTLISTVMYLARAYELIKSFKHQ